MKIFTGAVSDGFPINLKIHPLHKIVQKPCPHDGGTSTQVL